MLKRDGGNLLQEGLSDGGDMTDSALMHRFVSQGDSAAFEILVRRHGPMVLGVCRRVLHNGHDADDAFQTAFLVFFRKAHSIQTTAKVANWLYGVAYRSALKVKSARHTMRTRETQVEQMPDPQAATPEDRWSELEGLLDKELARLPGKYRLPIVLCDLEGSTIKEAARILGWPEGTVSGSLSRGRTVLRNRLAKHGLMLSVAALAGALARQTAAAAVPTPLLTSTIHGARLLASGQAGLAEAYSAKVAALTKGVMKSMLLAKLKLAGTALVALGVVGAGAAAVSRLPVHATTSGRILVAEVPPQSAAPVEPRPEPVQQDPPAGRTDQKVTAERTALESRRTLTAEEQAKADEKIAAEYASGRDSGPGHYQSGDQTDKIAAEKAALEKVTAEQRAAAAHQIASSDRK